ncbi:TadE/TadG family type IV pilus assembly protein [uncultured Sphingomonas sp.]|uniref:TadE/TadG family type IV pilus assembly protein n=1 Tax=uncultured Sphingomonas sp. TaxID=158754 RepID=UPI0035CA790C
MTAAIPQQVRRLALDRRGVTVIEFAIIAPVICLFLVGAMDMTHTLYMRTVLQGALQKAARDTALETGSSQAQRDVIDDRVKAQVAELNAELRTPGAIIITRRFYRTFTRAGAKVPEEFSDSDHDKICNHNELFEDVNGNGARDADGGDAGQGGAKDAVLYTVAVRYDRLLPLASLVPGVAEQVRLSASTILQNQPYADQGRYAATPVEGRCL